MQIPVPKAKTLAARSPGMRCQYFSSMDYIELLPVPKAKTLAARSPARASASAGACAKADVTGHGGSTGSYAEYAPPKQKTPPVIVQSLVRIAGGLTATLLAWTQAKWRKPRRRWAWLSRSGKHLREGPQMWNATFQATPRSAGLRVFPAPAFDL